MPLKPLSRPLAEPGRAQPPHLHDTGLGPASVTRRRPHQQRGCRHLLCLLSQLVRRSRAETPEGSQPAFAADDLARGLNPYPSHYRTAFASSLLLYPPPHRHHLAAGLPRREDDGLTTFRMSTTMGETPLIRRWLLGLRQENREPLHQPRTFWFKPLSAFGLLDLTTFISSSLELAMPSTLAPDRLDAGSRRVPSREIRPPHRGEVTLSQELRTARLPRPHVLVGYR